MFSDRRSSRLGTLLEIPNEGLQDLAAFVGPAGLGVHVLVLLPQGHVVVGVGEGVDRGVFLRPMQRRIGLPLRGGFAECDAAYVSAWTTSLALFGRFANRWPCVRLRGPLR